MLSFDFARDVGRSRQELVIPPSVARPKTEGRTLHEQTAGSCTDSVRGEAVLAANVPAKFCWQHQVAQLGVTVSH